MPQGTFGKLFAGSHFLSPDNDLTWGTGTVLVDGVGFVSVNEGSFEWTIDEPAGIVAVTTDTGDNDNAAFFLGTFQPADGGIWMETRFKFNSATLGAIFAGFSETLALDTPVMPLEFATATMTYNGTGGIMGASLDTDATTNDFRAAAGDGGAGVLPTGGTDSAGTRFNETITADEWYIVRVEMDQDGTGRVYVGHDGGLAGDLDVVEWTTAPVTPGDNFYAVVMFENRSAAARVFEVDYFYAGGGVDWAVD